MPPNSADQAVGLRRRVSATRWAGDQKVRGNPYIETEVEWTAERERHIGERHPELLPAHRARVEQTIADPDEVRSDGDYPNTRLFFRWYADLLAGKNVVVVVVSAEPPEARHWIVTAFVARRPPRGDLEWKRS